MKSCLDPAILSRVIQPVKPEPAKKRPEPFPYNSIVYDDVLENMFGKRWDELAVYPPRTTEIWSSLFAPVYGRALSLDEVRLVMGVAANTQSEALRQRAIDGLEDYIADCSGTDSSLKPAAQKLLQTLKETENETRTLTTGQRSPAMEIVELQTPEATSSF